MRYIYSITFSILIASGIYLYTNGIQTFGVIAISFGGLCWLYNTFGKRANLFIILFSLVSLAGICYAYNSQPINAFANNIINSIKQDVSSSDAISTRGIASVESMRVGIAPPGMSFSAALFVELKPHNAEADTPYKVELYDKDGECRATTTIAWNKAQINTKETKFVYFPLSNSEFNAYSQVANLFLIKDNNWWKSIFNINILSPYMK